MVKWLAVAAAAMVALPLALLVVVAAGASSGSARAAFGGAPTAFARQDIPAAYLVLYVDAARTCPGLPWSALAGIGKVESDHGRWQAQGVPSRGNSAEGPMQFLPARFAEYAADGDHDGTLNINDPADAIFTVAAMLCANGAAAGTPGGLARAVYAYNHSRAHVADVLSWAARYATPAETIGAASTSATESRIAATAIGFAMTQLGKPYLWGAAGPDAYDCSGLVYAAYAAAGIHIARTTFDWRKDGPRVALASIEPGDLLFSAGSDGTMFSRDPGCEIRINPSVCPAQMAVPGPSVNAAGVVDEGLSRWQKCAAARVILFAASQLGKPYAWGATGPDAFDCSGLTMMAYRSAGIAIPRTSQEQWAAGPYVPPGQEQPGDLVFFPGSDGTAQDPGHAGIVLGGGLMIDAPYTGAPVRVDVIAGEVGFTRPAAGM